MKKSVDAEMRSMKKQVTDILRQDERARNDDKWLLYRVWSSKVKMFIPFEQFNELPMPETVRRVRQKIQNEDNLYLPTDEKIIERRQIREDSMRKWAVRDKATVTLEDY